MTWPLHGLPSRPHVLLNTGSWPPPHLIWAEQGWRGIRAPKPWHHTVHQWWEMEASPWADPPHAPAIMPHTCITGPSQAQLPHNQIMWGQSARLSMRELVHMTSMKGAHSCWILGHGAWEFKAKMWKVFFTILWSQVVFVSKMIRQNVLWNIFTLNAPPGVKFRSASENSCKRFMTKLATWNMQNDNPTWSTNLHVNLMCDAVKCECLCYMLNDWRLSSCQLVIVPFYVNHVRFPEMSQTSDLLFISMQKG